MEQRSFFLAPSAGTRRRGRRQLKVTCDGRGGQTEAPELAASSPFPGRCAARRPIHCSHKGGISIFLWHKFAPLIASAPCLCSPHLRTLSHFYFPSLPSPASSAACYSCTFHHPHPPITGSSSDGYCASSGGEKRGN